MSDVQLISMESSTTTSTRYPVIQLIAEEPRQFREGYILIRASATSESAGGDLEALLQVGQFLRQDNSPATFRLHWHTATTGQDLTKSGPDLSLKSPSLVSRMQDLRHMTISPSAMDSKHWIEAKAELFSRANTTELTVADGEEPSAATGIYWSVVISANSSPGRTKHVKKRLSE